MEIIAHRGLFDQTTIPENSMSAFRRAVDYHIPIELDVQLTKDNVLVVFHDFNLKRMTGKNALIQECTYEEIQNLCLLNTKEHIPLFRDVLKLVQGRVLLDIEIKSTKRILETCTILMKELENYSNYLLKSFHPGIVRFLKKHYPKETVGLLLGNRSTYPNSFYYPLLSNPFIRFYCHPDFLSLSKDLWKKKSFQKLRNKYPIYLWTIQKKEELKDKNLHYICENLPYSSFRDYF